MDTLRALRDDPGADPRLPALCAMAERLDGTLRTCEALLLAGRAVDLDGLDVAAGRLCAAVLDLPPEIGRHFAEPLAGLLARLDGVEAAIRGAGRGERGGGEP